MPLIKCPMCEKMISPNAESCPNCGEPIRSRIDKLGLYTLVLEDKGVSPIAAIKKIRKVVGEELVSKDFIADNVSYIEIIDNLTLERAKNLKKEIEESGATIQIVPKRKASPDFDVEVKPQNNTSIIDYDYLNTIKCPNCKSDKVHKISGLSKAGSAIAFGILSIGKLSKTFQCDDCGYRW